MSKHAPILRRHREAAMVCYLGSRTLATYDDCFSAILERVAQAIANAELERDVRAAAIVLREDGNRASLAEITGVYSGCSEAAWELYGDIVRRQEDSHRPGDIPTDDDMRALVLSGSEWREP